MQQARRRWPHLLVCLVPMLVVLAAPVPAHAGRAHRRVGWLSIESRPPDAVRLYINGRRAGVTPVRRLRVRAGRRLLLEAIRPDGARQRRVLRVRPGQERHLVLAS